jgi:hypothetical protein
MVAFKLSCLTRTGSSLERLELKRFLQEHNGELYTITFASTDTKAQGGYIQFLFRELQPLPLEWYKRNFPPARVVACEFLPEHDNLEVKRLILSCFPADSSIQWP